MKDRTFLDLYAKAEKSLAYHVEGAILEFTEELCRLMESQGVSRAELARRLDTSPAYVTKILRGTSNFTLETMVRAAQALGCEVKIRMAPDSSRTLVNEYDRLAPQQVAETRAPYGEKK
jgi:transcriptional regulator with XRE-family HTH domain